MRTLSRREKLFVGIFVVALIWGIWNYREMFFESGKTATPKPVAALTPATVPPAPAATTTGIIADTKPAKGPQTSKPVPTYAWDRNPFHRDWR